MHIITATACIYILTNNNLDASNPDRATHSTPGRLLHDWARHTSSFEGNSPRQQSEPPPQNPSSTTALVAPQEQYERMPENRIRNSFGSPSKGLQYIETTTYTCGSRQCKKIFTNGDGHCFYHAIALSVYYGKHKRRHTPDGREILEQMVRVILSDVMQMLHQMTSYTPDRNDRSWVDNLSKFDSAIEECKLLRVKDKALEVYSALPRRYISEKILLFVYLVCRYPNMASLRHTEAVTIFRGLTYIPGVMEEIGHAYVGVAADRVIQGEIVIAHDRDHYSGLDCTIDPNPPQGLLADKAEISYEKDTTFAAAYSRIVGSWVRCSHRECEVLGQPNRQYSYLHALFVSAQNTGLGDPHRAADNQVLTWLTTAANTIFEDIQNFNRALEMYREVIGQSSSKELLKHKEDVFMQAIPMDYLDFFLQGLKRSVAIGQDVERHIRERMNPDKLEDMFLSRHFIFTVYCYINGLGVFTPTMVLLNHYVQMNLDFRVTECLFKQGESQDVTDDIVECETENAVSGAPVAEEPHEGPTVAVVSTIIKLEPGRQPEIHYFGLRCDS